MNERSRKLFEQSLQIGATYYIKCILLYCVCFIVCVYYIGLLKRFGV